MKIKFEWKAISRESDPGDCQLTERAKVIGGWIVRYGRWISYNDQHIAVTMVFVSDPSHEWQVE